MSRPNSGRDGASVRRSCDGSMWEQALVDVVRAASHLKPRFDTLAGKLRGITIVVLEKAAESFPIFDSTTVQPNFFPRFDDLVAQPLMISFAVKMRKELADSISQRPFTEEDHARKAFLFQRSVEPFDV